MQHPWLCCCCSMCSEYSMSILPSVTFTYTLVHIWTRECVFFALIHAQRDWGAATLSTMSLLYHINPWMYCISAADRTFYVGGEITLCDVTIKWVQVLGQQHTHCIKVKNKVIKHYIFIAWFVMNRGYWLNCLHGQPCTRECCPNKILLFWGEYSHTYYCQHVPCCHHPHQVIISSQPFILHSYLSSD